MLTACQARSGASTWVDNTGFLLVYVNFRSSAYVQEIACRLEYIEMGMNFLGAGRLSSPYRISLPCKVTH